MKPLSLTFAVASIQRDHPGKDLQAWTVEGHYAGKATVIDNGNMLVIQQEDADRVHTWFVAAEHVIALRRAP